jgi:6-pyruvoyltetrahydropterin/6-carboxytetrahydropterin synthase
MYHVTKHYAHTLGLSTAFRQWRAHSHCRFVHGYPLAFTLEFRSQELDITNWVVDFGAMKSLKGLLEQTFDHKFIVAEDDPQIEYFKLGKEKGVLDLVILPHAGCEKFAEYVFGAAEVWLIDNGFAPRVQLHKVTCAEHGGNSASYSKD